MDEDLERRLVKLELDLQATRWLLKRLVDARGSDAAAFYAQAASTVREVLDAMPLPDNAADAYAGILAESIGRIASPINHG